MPLGHDTQLKSAMCYGRQSVRLTQYRLGNQEGKIQIPGLPSLLCSLQHISLFEHQFSYDKQMTTVTWRMSVNFYPTIMLKDWLRDLYLWTLSIYTASSPHLHLALTFSSLLVSPLSPSYLVLFCLLLLFSFLPFSRI